MKKSSSDFAPNLDLMGNPREFIDELPNKMASTTAHNIVFPVSNRATPWVKRFEAH
ncbi:hypothetical protein [Rhizobiales bacterium]|uniref:hypothetical protein n=1 Tax=Agrobacterium radiobacter TaxID=362 RepID=UPI0013A6C2F2